MLMMIIGIILSLFGVGVMFFSSSYSLFDILVSSTFWIGILLIIMSYKSWKKIMIGKGVIENGK